MLLIDSGFQKIKIIYFYQNHLKGILITLSEVYIKDDEVAKTIGISKNTLAKWRMAKNKGSNLVFVKIGRNILYKRDSIKQWLQDNERIDTGGLTS